MGLNNFAAESVSFRQKVKEIAEAEWERFDLGCIKECDDGGWQRIGDYWREGVNKPDRDGCDTQHKWSAAFVSWVMKKAGAGDAFQYDSRHSVYIRDAIQKRDDPGGRANDALKQEIQQALQPVVAESDIGVEIAGANHPMNGSDPQNIVNRLPQGNGIQIEQPKVARERHWREIAKAVALVYNSKLS